MSRTAPRQALARRVSTSLGLVSLCGACAGQSPEWSEQQATLSTYADHAAWSRKPPGLEPVDVPQFVAVTFDDNFVTQ